MSVLAASPEELRRAARGLRGMAADLEGMGRSIGGAGVPAGVWTGLAALEQTARTEELARLVALASRPGEEVAAALDRCALGAEECAARVRAGLRAAEEASAELAVLAAHPPLEAALAGLWQTRQDQLELALATARAQVARGEDDYRAVQEQVARVVELAWSAVPVLALLRQLRGVPKGLFLTAGTVLRAAVGTDVLVALARARWGGSPAVRSTAAGRARRALDRWARLESLDRALQRPVASGRAPRGATPPPPPRGVPVLRTGPQSTGDRLLGKVAGKGLRLALGPAGMALAWVGAWSDIRTGGGYTGWRGGTTKALAGAALVGGGVAAVGAVTPLAPVLVPAGGLAVEAYSAWMFGNAVYDARVPLLQRGRQLVGWTGRQAVRARDVAARRVTQATDVAVATGGKVGRALDHVRGRAIDVARRLPDLPSWRDRWREVGSPVGLPEAPLGPALRPPVDLGRLRP